MDLYGITYRKSDRVQKLADTLEAALDTGQCKELAPRFVAVRDRLRKEYDDAFIRLGDKLFAEITGGPGEEAEGDPARFVAKHFLGADGQPDRAKTKDVLAFRCGSHERQELREVVDTVPGLSIVMTWRTVFVGWETEMQRSIEAEFSRLESVPQPVLKMHSALASVDLGLFLKRYLGIGPDGAAPPADARPSTAIQLNRWELQNQKLPEEIMAKTPGLCMKEVEYTAVIIGWDAVSVAAGIASLREAQRLAEEKEAAEERAAQEKEKAEVKARWDRRTKGHTELKSRVTANPSPLTLQRLVGSYLVQWDSTGEDSTGDQYNDPWHDSELMRVDVFLPLGSGKTHGVKARFHFGDIEGTMLLGMTRRDVELLRDMQRDHDYTSDSEDSDLEVPPWGGFKAPKPAMNAGPTTARTLPIGAKRPLGEIADPWGVQAARAKRQMLEAAKTAAASSPPTTRVYFQYVCSEEVEGWPILDHRNEHIGYFDFDQTGLAAKGVLDCPDIGKHEEPLSLFKISETPSRDRKPKPWCKYDGRHWGRRW
ncbi:hypothetical protein C8A05DRAFT_20050 [Staphylotrichum tortipilum]|uniref:Uncharacterized protein n=1 Tax=Staphylotrichum tortipilum TaxID=2831512 RepID=A0AAN6RNM7_9PEZI|nr:hypothetical protein C8A05DRAFT_20050 [Staphylotrichum longicolle]